MSYLTMPKPLKYVEDADGMRTATFDPRELRDFLASNSDESAVVRDDLGKVVGVLRLTSLRETFLPHSSV